MKFLIVLLGFQLMSVTAFPKPIKVGYSPVLSSAGLMLAKDKGYFKEEGIEVDFLTFDSSGAAMTPLLGKGELDVGAGNLSSGLLNAVNEGVSIYLVADKGTTPASSDGYMGLIVRTDHLQSGRYKSLKDLKGFTIGLTSLGGVSQQILFEKFLAKAGLKSEDVKYIKLGYPDMNVALEKKALDATIQLEPYISMAEKAGFAKKVADASEAYPGQQSGVLIYSEKFAKQKKEAVAFMKAYLRGVRLYNKAMLTSQRENRDEVVKILDAYLNLEPNALWSSIRPVGLDPTGNLNEENLMNDLKWYTEKRYLKQAPALNKLVNLSFAKEASAELDKKNGK